MVAFLRVDDSQNLAIVREVKVLVGDYFGAILVKSQVIVVKIVESSKETHENPFNLRLWKSVNPAVEIYAVMKFHGLVVLEPCVVDENRRKLHNDVEDPVDIANGVVQVAHKVGGLFNRTDNLEKV